MGIFDFIKETGSKILKGNREERIAAAKEAADSARKAAESRTKRTRGRASDLASRAAEEARKRSQEAREAAMKAKALAEKQAAKAAEAANLGELRERRDAMRASFLKRRSEAKKSAELEDYVQKLDLGDDIDVRFDDGTAYISGEVADQATLERVVLAIGNVAGVEKVDEDLELADGGETKEETEERSVLYTVRSGDTLSAISQRYYGDAGRYNEIFEANRPMLSDPNLIYPGQVLRIPGV